MGRLPRSGRVETVTSATPEQVWSIVSDVTRVGEWSHECHAGVWLDGATTAAPGARFTGSNRSGWAKWSRISEVVSADAPDVFSWRTVPRGIYTDSTLWRISIASEGDVTRITQTYEIVKLNPIVDRMLYLTMPAHRDRMAALQADIDRLGRVAAGGPVSSPSA